MYLNDVFSIQNMLKLKYVIPQLK